jgi:hypothetical protein
MDDGRWTSLKSEIRNPRPRNPKEIRKLDLGISVFHSVFGFGFRVSHFGFHLDLLRAPRSAGFRLRQDGNVVGPRFLSLSREVRLGSLRAALR